jgi:hypothetical protein
MLIHRAKRIGFAFYNDRAGILKFALRRSEISHAARHRHDRILCKYRHEKALVPRALRADLAESGRWTAEILLFSRLAVPILKATF